MPVNHSTNQIQVQLDLEMEKTLRRLRKEARLNTMAIAQQQTLKELAAPCRASEKPRAASASWRWRFFSLLLELILFGVAT